MTPRAPHTPRTLPTRRWVLVTFVVLVVAILAADQFAKAGACAWLASGPDVTLIPGVLSLTLVRNVGAAFGIFGGHIGAFVACAAIVIAVCVGWLALAKGHTRLETVALGMVCAGALGNVIDRVSQGFVTDMIKPLFIDFPVFNIADIAITCGFVLFLITVIFGSGAIGTRAPREEDAV